ncbi:MAG: DUF1329 domain-containing protein [Piscinibacter sp.]|uniref:DUF1329 domain-containing protein n=1 Tax=Piscinibacter TaxID=1114981 RepID=UPI000FDD2027|nr:MULTISPECIES: DUF1329 domain-containing protein [Piscinibacter]MCW5663252.1 DUF1329 domain-containing protein [Piscinibacter sp.]
MTSGVCNSARIALACVALATAQIGVAQSRDAARLGKDLTGVGAEPGAGAGGVIPAFAPAGALEPGWAPGKPRGDFFKFKGDKPLYTIDAGNVDQHAAKLSPGQVALIKQVKGYRMDVYPSRRTCANPDFVLENTKKNVATAKLGADGWSLKDAVLPGIPFPMPANGAEAMWNAKLKYAGVGYEWPLNYIALSPRKGSNDWIRAGATQTYYYPWGKKGSTPLAQLPPVEYYTYFAYESPTALAGQALAIVFYTDKPGDTFYYFPGQRRVRRMPTYAYDAPQIGFENQYTMDEPRMFNGTMDRFDWTLVGKKELVVGYNSFGMYDPAVRLDSVLGADMPASEARRYELHRVWVVEATVKQGVRHVAPKRTFYLDEDSWSIVVAEDYDAQGKLWKLRESFVIPVHETGSCDNPAFVQHNLIDGRYVFDQSPLGAGKDMRWVVESKEPKFSEGFYTADNLRSISER